MQCVVCGTKVFYMCNEALIAWFPERSGMAVGLGTLAFGFGIVGLTSLFSTYLSTFSVSDAILRASYTLTFGMVPAVIFMRWPDETSFGDDATVITVPCAGSTEEEAVPILDSGATQADDKGVGFVGILKNYNFWLYVIVLFTTGASFCLNPYFYKIGLLYGASFDALVFWYNFINIVSTFAGLFAGAMMDSPYLRTQRGYWSSPSRNVMLGLMFTQTVLMALMVHANNTKCFWLFILGRCVLSVIVTVHACAAILLARDIFGNRDGSRAFGIGAGLSLGAGDSWSVVLMAISLYIAVGGLPKLTSDFNLFYEIAVAWSVVGVLCAALIKTKT